ncbi:GSCOCG00012041001-RA-CDS [Cotesia congregata]|nr:GSCOCG00012041001-RA-CDS [Cotesia congregata]
MRALRTSNTTRLLMGHIFKNDLRQTNPRSKWYVAAYMYGEKIVPNYAVGHGYIMSSDVGLILYKTALTTPVVHLEDVYLTGICVKKANLSLIDYPRFEYLHQSFFFKFLFTEPEYYENHIIVHCDNIFEMYKIWKKLNTL